MTTIEFAATTNVGPVRRRNEDCFGFTGVGAVQDSATSSHGLRRGLPFLAVIADGVGGSPDGDVAARLVVETIIDLAPNDRESLVAAVLESHRLLMDGWPTAGGVGSTVAALLVLDSQVVCVNVGDSRTYLVDPEGPMTQLTIDDTPVSAVHFPVGLGQGLTQCLGSANRSGSVAPHVMQVDLAVPMRLVMCTDGLSGFVTPLDISDVARTDEASVACGRLADVALIAGSTDNTTVVIVDVRVA